MTKIPMKYDWYEQTALDLSNRERCEQKISKNSNNWSDFLRKINNNPNSCT